MKRFSKFYITFLIISIIGNLSFCSRQSRAKLGTAKQILHKGNGTEPQGLDPHIVTGVPEHHILAALFEGLIGEDPKDLSPVPGVAKSWKISNGGLTYIFKLQPDAKWSNGDKLIAKDFVYSWRRVLSPKLASEYAYMLHYVKNAKAFNKGKIKDFSLVGAQAIDNETFEVTLANPTPFFLNVLQHYSTFPVHKKTIEKFGKIDRRGTKWTRVGNMVSNGPFVLTKWQLNHVVRVKKNPMYWDAKMVRLQEINFYATESQQTEERSFRVGELHVTNEVPIHKIEVYKKNNPKLIRISPFLGTYFYRINTTREPFTNPKVRRAFAMTLNRDQLVRKVTKAGELPAFAFTPPETSGYTPKASFKEDVVEARKLLADAGFPGGKDLPKIDILYNTSDKHLVVAEAIQDMWKKALGVEVSLSNQDWKVYLDSQTTMNYTICRAGWIGDYPDPNTFLDMFVTDGGQNKTGWSNKTYDSLIAQAGRTSGKAQRYEIFQRAEKILLDEMPIIPIYIYTRVFLISTDVKNWFPTIQDHHPYKHVYLAANK